MGVESAASQQTVFWPCKKVNMRGPAESSELEPFAARNQPPSVFYSFFLLLLKLPPSLKIFLKHTHTQHTAHTTHKQENPSSTHVRLVVPDDELAGPVANDKRREHGHYHVGAHARLELERRLYVANGFSRGPGNILTHTGHE